VAFTAFTDNYADNSTDAGFQFTFYCQICHEGYKSKFIESKTYKKAGVFRNVGRVAGIAGSLIGKHNLGWNIERGSDLLGERFQGMSPEWHREHERAFELAQNEAKGHFHRCPKCTRWVCENDWNEQAGLCIECAPREAVEVAAARAQKMVTDIREKADTTQVFTGEVEARTTLCPMCGKPAGQGKFCVNCGSRLDMQKCPRCGAKNSAESRFCGECGMRLE
jgi:hypothetical protein